MSRLRDIIQRRKNTRIPPDTQAVIQVDSDVQDWWQQWAEAYGIKYDLEASYKHWGRMFRVDEKVMKDPYHKQIMQEWLEVVAASGWWRYTKDGGKPAVIVGSYNNKMSRW